MSLEPSFNDTADIYFDERSLLVRMAAEGKTEEFARRVASAEAVGVTLCFFRRDDGKRVLARATARDGFFHGRGYGFIDTMYSADLASWVGFGALRELFDPKSRGFIPIEAERRTADVY